MKNKIFLTLTISSMAWWGCYAAGFEFQTAVGGDVAQLSSSIVNEPLDSTPSYLHKPISQSRLSALQSDLENYTNHLKAKVGVAVIVNEKDTVAVNGLEEFPMFSVFKFPLALAVAQHTDNSGMKLEDVIQFEKEKLNPDTYSPMLKKYGPELSQMSIKELLEWSLKESDNNAADILLDFIGGIPGINALMRELNIPEGIAIGATESDMYCDNNLSYLNMSTPTAMATLFSDFNKSMRNRSASFLEIADMLENCNTGTDRLFAPLQSTGAVLGHKTGTGFITPDQIIMGLNDCGYVILPDGSTYSIAVFITESPYSPQETTKIISDLSKITYDSLTAE